MMPNAMDRSGRKKEKNVGQLIRDTEDRVK